MVLAIGIFFMNNMILNLYAEVFGLPVMEAKLLTELTLFILSFTIQRFWIFRKSVKRRPSEKESSFMNNLRNEKSGQSCWRYCWQSAS